MLTRNDKATANQVPFGSLTIEGLRDEQGNYYIAATQAAMQMKLTAHPSNATRSLQRILGEEFQRIRLKIELSPNPVTAITLRDFEKLMLLKQPSLQFWFAQGHASRNIKRILRKEISFANKKLCCLAITWLSTVSGV